MKTVSVCMPVYNAEKTISYAIESILNSTYKNIEIIIFDNNSTDKTVDIIKKYMLYHSRGNIIKLKINNKNLGPVNNLNLCISNAAGELKLL